MFDKKAKAVRTPLVIATDVQQYFRAAIDELSVSGASLEAIRDAFCATLPFASESVIRAVGAFRQLAVAKLQGATCDSFASGPVNINPQPAPSFADKAHEFLFGENISPELRPR